MEFKEEIAHIGYRKDIKYLKQGNLWLRIPFSLFFFLGKKDRVMMEP